MVNPVENPNCYASAEQQKIITVLSGNEKIRNSFFLTGGTALSVFYLHHRKSNDLDWFSINKPQFQELERFIRNVWQKGLVVLVKEPYILSVELNGTKVDFVHDPLSFEDEKLNIKLNEDNFFFIDSIRNMASNKLCALVGRQEPKDFIDFYFINEIKLLTFDSIYNDAQKKEGMFDDPPTVAYQLENSFNSIKQNPFAFPEMMIDFKQDEFYSYYEALINKIYHRKPKKI